MTYCSQGIFEGTGQQTPCIYDNEGNYAALGSSSTSCLSGMCTFFYDMAGNALATPVVNEVSKIRVPPNVILSAESANGNTIFQLGGDFVRQYNTTPMYGYGDVTLTGEPSYISTLTWETDTVWSRFITACSGQQIPALGCQQFASGSSAGWNASFSYDSGPPPPQVGSNRWLVYFLLSILAVSLFAIVITSAYLSYQRNKVRKSSQQNYEYYKNGDDDYY